MKELINAAFAGFCIGYFVRCAQEVVREIRDMLKSEVSASAPRGAAVLDGNAAPAASSAAPTPECADDRPVNAEHHDERADGGDRGEVRQCR